MFHKIFFLNAIVLLVIEIAASILNRSWNLRILGPESWFDLYVVTLFRAVLGQTALWSLIAGLRTRLFAQMATHFSASAAFEFCVFLLITAALMIFSSYKAMARVYTALPQAYGGGRSLRVQLYVEREKIPLELLTTSSGGEKTAMVYTVPVEMIFRASDAFIVNSVSNGAHRVWTLDARIVHAVLSSPKGLTGP